MTLPRLPEPLSQYNRENEAQFRRMLERLFQDAVQRMTAPGGPSGPDLSGVPFVTMSTSGLVTAERVLTAGSGIGIADGGAGGAVTVSVLLEAGTGVTLTPQGPGNPIRISATLEDLDDPIPPPTSPHPSDEEWRGTSLPPAWTVRVNVSAPNEVRFSPSHSPSRLVVRHRNTAGDFFAIFRSFDLPGDTPRVTAKFSTGFVNSVPLFGLAVSDGSNGAAVSAEVLGFTGARFASYSNYETGAGFVSHGTIGSLNGFLSNSRYYLHLERDPSSTVWRGYLSYDGVTWVEIAGVSSVFTPARIHLLFQNFAGGNPGAFRDITCDWVRANWISIV